MIFVEVALLIIMVLGSMFILFSFLTFYSAIRPAEWPIDFSPDSFDVKYNDVSFKTEDALKLHGWFLPAKNPKGTIIVMHGYPTRKSDVLPFSLFLLKKFNVFVFDFRSFGDSEGSYTTVGFREVRDLDAAVRYLSKTEKNIGVLGFSMGGAVAIMDHNSKVKAIVSDSSYSSLAHMINNLYAHFLFLRKPLVYLTCVYSKALLGVNVKDVSPVVEIKKITKPILIIHSKKDRHIPVQEAYDLHNANKKSELWIVENGDHGTTYALNKDAYEKRVLNFFSKNLKWLDVKISSRYWLSEKNQHSNLQMSLKLN